MGMQFGPLWWSAIHRKHHKKCDQPEDPHSWKQTSFIHSWLFWVLHERVRGVSWEWVHPSLYVTDSKGKQSIAPEMLLMENLWFMPFVINHLILYYVCGLSARNIFVYYSATSSFIPPPILLFNVMFHPTDHPNPTKHGCHALDTSADFLAGLMGESQHELHHKFPNMAKRPAPIVDIAWYTILLPLKTIGAIWDVKMKAQ